MPSQPSGSGTVLQTRDLSRDFRGFRAVNSVDLDVEEGSVHALVGPNGAGKTTLFNLLTGFLKPTEGRVSIGGTDTTRLRPDQVAGLGVARSFQITSLFERLPCRDHVELALAAGTGMGYRFWRSDKLLAKYAERAEELLDEVGLAELAGVPASELAYGQKRALELAIVLARDPRLMLLDEPTAGMGMEDVARTVELIRYVHTGRTVVLIEHNMSVVGNLADKVTVLQHGEILVEGRYDDVRADPAVVAAYLGEPGAERS
ncbi:MAG TPA: ABC transporter ATP-binding protein [Nocardioidaceae bacterium]|nr:ABC transporter ATP-binding protein [Nocardioidaceae bacterium]